MRRSLMRFLGAEAHIRALPVHGLTVLLRTRQWFTVVIVIPALTGTKHLLATPFAVTIASPCTACHHSIVMVVLTVATESSGPAMASEADSPKGATMMLKRNAFIAMLAASTALVQPTVALAQTPADADTPVAGDIVVTAQKRSESLQSVPLSIIALNGERLQNLEVRNFQDYASFLPSISFARGSTGVPGNISVSFRGIATDGGLIGSGTLPTVGIYLDEQPISSITGALDIHAYDIARVESLAGPQGTLYGASAESGVLRIITNKPDASKFHAGFDVEANKILSHGAGGSAEGFVNVPIVADRVALRAVGWYVHTGGYISSIARSRTFATSKITQTSLVGKDLNSSDVVGARAQLGIDLDDNWTVTPSAMYQKTTWDGPYRSDDDKAGVLNVAHFFPEFGRDEFYQLGGTITGKVANFDVTYAGYYMKRAFASQNDYADYGFYYDAIAGSGSGVVDNAGKLIDPSQLYNNHRITTKLSQEFRIATPQAARLRAIAGLFYQRQTELGEDDYLTPNFATKYSVPGRPGQVWLTLQNRIDRDYAVFGQADFDVTDQLTVTGGLRGYKFDNTLVGFYGVNTTYFGTGVRQCLGPKTGPYGVGAAVVDGTPCTNLGILNADGSISPKRSKGSGVTYRANATYKFDADHLVYATVSSGFRPGGINRAGAATPFDADKLTNYEVGTKNSFMGRRLTLNLTAFQEDWKDVQVTFQAPGGSGVAQITNAGGARARGIEGDVSYRDPGGFSLLANAAYVDAKLTTPLFTGGTTPSAPAGARLPLTPQFKGSLTARYEFDVGPWRTHFQGAVAYIGDRIRTLPTSDSAKLGISPGYTQIDASVGATHGDSTVELYVRNLNDVRGEQSRSAECNINYCGPSSFDRVGEIYRNYNQPRTIGLRFGQKF